MPFLGHGSPSALYPDHSAQPVHRRRALVQPSLLFRRELDLDDLLNALRGHPRLHADTLAPISRTLLDPRQEAVLRRPGTPHQYR